MKTIIIVPSGVELMNIAHLEQGPPLPWQRAAGRVGKKSLLIVLVTTRQGFGEEVLGSLG